MTLSAAITTWLARGQTTEGLANLTGRTKIWGPLLAFPRDKFQEIFGFVCPVGNRSDGVPRHPEAQTMAAFVDGTLSPGEVTAVAEHLRGCGECRTVVSETAPGYTLHGRVLRPAMVAVAAAPDEDAA